MNLANTKKVGMYGKLIFVGYVQQQKNNLDYLHTNNLSSFLTKIHHLCLFCYVHHLIFY